MRPRPPHADRPPLNVEDAAEQAATATHARLLHPDAPAWPPAALATDLAEAQSVWLLIGPEGGFSPDELPAPGTTAWSELAPGPPRAAHRDRRGGGGVRWCGTRAADAETFMVCSTREVGG